MLIEIALGLFLIFLIWECLKKPKDYPPGYWGLPLVGYLPLDGRALTTHLNILRNQYGDITSWRIGTRLVVILSDYKLCKENLNRVEFVHRPNLALFNFFAYGKNLGLVGSNGIIWQNDRRFSMRLLRDLGMGKSRMVEAVQHEAVELVEDLKKLAGKPTKLPHSIAVAVINVIWQMIASKRYSLDNEELINFEKMMDELQNNTIPLTIPDFFPWLLYILPTIISDKLFFRNKGDETRGKFHKFMTKLIEEHKKDLNPDDPRDYIDNYLLEMKKQENDETSTMSIEDLIVCICDLFGAGSETTKITLTFMFYYLSNFPKIQERMHSEIDNELRKDTLVTLDNKERLPYTEAFIHEIHRHITLARLGVMRQATEDCKINDYFVPKGTFLAPNFLHCHHDPRYWESPHEFKPERFLDKNGKFILPKEGFLPFGAGKRQCLGESLVRVEIFIFLVTILQNMSFSPPPGKFMDLKPNPSSPMFSVPNDSQEILITIR